MPSIPLLRSQVVTPYQIRFLLQYISHVETINVCLHVGWVLFLSHRGKSYQTQTPWMYTRLYIMNMVLRSIRLNYHQYFGIRCFKSLTKQLWYTTSWSRGPRVSKFTNVQSRILFQQPIWITLSVLWWYDIQILNKSWRYWDKDATSDIFHASYFRHIYIYIICTWYDND